MIPSGPAALDVIRQRWLLLHCGMGAPESTRAALTNAVGKIDRFADKIMARQIWDPSHPDHGNPYGKPVDRAKFIATGGMLGMMGRLACAWRCPFSQHSKSPEVLARIVAGLRYAEPFLNPELPKDGAWHSWDIGMPLALSYTLLLCGDELPADLRKSLLNILAHMPSRVFTLDREQGITRPPMTSGSNNVEILYVGMLRGLILNDPQWLDTVTRQLPIAMGRAADSEGLQPDWSYQFHGHGVNAGYGSGALCVQGHWIYLVRGTPWQVPDEIRDLQVGMFREFFGRDIWRGRVAPYSIDRGIASRGGIYAPSIFEAALFGLASDLPPADRAVFAAGAADYLRHLEPDGTPAPPFLEFRSILLSSQVSQPIQGDLKLLSGIRYYPDSQYLLVREPDWFAAVRMSSGRTKAWNSMLGAHAKGSSGGEFSIAFMTDGREFDHTTLPTMNWKRLMGVTSCDSIEMPPESYGQSTFCGGLSGDEFTVLGLQYLLAPAGQATVRANKSFFVTPEMMILLGTQVRCSADEPVVTTLFQSPLIDGAVYQRNGQPLDTQSDFTIDLKAGDTLYLRNTGVRLLTDAQLIVETRRGTYAELNLPEVAPTEPADKSPFNELFERRWVYLVVNHGVRPRAGRYGALLYPMATTDRLPSADVCRILLEENHHRVDLPNGLIGGEVRFPGDWRKKIGLSYWGAEQHQWGSIARWLPADDAQHAQLEITSPRRFVRAEQSGTEIFLPDGFELENVTLKTYAGTPFPANLMDTSANGKIHKLRVRKKA